MKNKEDRYLLVGRIIILIGVIQLLICMPIGISFLFDHDFKTGVLLIYLPVAISLVCSLVGGCFTWLYPMMNIGES
jgi:hypothetical protein